MQGNDLSNLSLPSIIVIFDGLIGTPKISPPAEETATLFGRIRKGLRPAPPAVVQWDLDPIVVATLQRLDARGVCDTEIRTFTDDLAGISKALSTARVRYRSLALTQPDQLARDLAQWPHVAVVYDANPQHVWTYGSRGRYVTPQLRSQIGTF